MLTLSPLKKTLVASALIVPLALVACGSDSEDTEATTTATASSTAAAGEEASDEENADTAAAGTDTETEAGAEENAEAGAKARSADGSTAAAARGSIDPAAAAADPLANSQLTFAELPPVEGGQPAGEEEQAAIESLVNGMYEADTLHEFFGYLPANTCNEVIQANGGAAAFDLEGIPDLPMNSIPGYAESNPRVEAINDVQIDGEVASASVTAFADGESTTKVQRFRLEDGAWKFCN
ncbi:hypothetical protein COCCU_09180 [Corynebacterium occultum]|uniref:Secreted protein n=1 Tax=Corynebacterium occultum TaxID=2675219 RepID=A0A6B8WCP3_9CORY|nr:hypothetical protein [Corynebacterium occultum]QGU07760.1 hypothetical protein COCCU_09180 [Corynebacterium occultum]